MKGTKIAYTIIIILTITVGVLLGLLLLDNKTPVVRSTLKDDFYMYINADEFARRDIPSANGGWDRLSDLQINVNTRIYSITNELVRNNNDNKVKKFYSVYTDKSKRNSLGTNPIDGYIEKINNIKSIKDYLDTTLEFKKEGVLDFALDFNVTRDPRDSSKYILLLEASPCYIYTDSAYSNMLKLAFDEVEELLELYGYDKDEITRISKEALELDNKACENTMSVVDWQDPKKIHVVISIDELKRIYSNIDLDYYLNELGLSNVKELMIEDKQFHINSNKLLTESNLEILKEELISNILSKYSKYLTYDFYNLSESYENKLNGTTGIRSLEDSATKEIKEELEYYIAEKYIDKYVDEDKRDYVVDMIEEIVKYYKNDLKNNEWMSSSTKEKAITKLDNLTIRVGYPDKLINAAENYIIKDYSEGGNAVSNEIAIEKAKWEKDLDILFGRYYYDGWEGIPLLDVNAYYNATDNSINFPLAILDLVDLDDSFYGNLGRIGMVIAHEISHAFDSAGSLYDEKGNMNNWWTDEDMEEYEKRTSKIVEYYSNYKNPYGTTINSELTLGENIADLGAVECITGIAKEKNATEKELKELFESFAKFWANEYNEALSAKQILTDDHSPNNVRVNATLSSNDLFYEVYSITEGDGMYHAPKDRVKLW